MQEAAKKDQHFFQKDMRNSTENMGQVSAIIQSLNAALPTHSNLHQNPEFCKALSSILIEASMDNLRINTATLNNKLAVRPDLCH
jgi:hypothetical protein